MLYHKLEVVVLVGQTILLERPCAPAVYAGKAYLALLHVNLGELTGNEVTAVASPFLIFIHAVVEVLGEVVECRSLHRCVALEGQAFACLFVYHREGTHVGVVAALLRTYVLEVLVSHVCLILANELA